MYIEKINGPEDVKKLTVDEMTVMAGEMREALLKRASIHGGHFGPNFGMVEATIALHYVFESPKDKIVYYVSHQTYPHKMLTGRKDAYLYEEKYDSPDFPNIQLQPYAPPCSRIFFHKYSLFNIVFRTRNAPLYLYPALEKSPVLVTY